ncbi:related to putative multidrug transporter [Cephalotrichum gorgonifer]|uniref:Related to putative multidrug transporter n=1 Tax=Cephalotrichum gorgonifer TaxID=2041049 RepID=A0AAE8MXB6_9PEZI|nr:related to putative multidrug transporter [Cephalotrichum gorgonifer]
MASSEHQDPNRITTAHANPGSSASMFCKSLNPGYPTARNSSISGPSTLHDDDPITGVSMPSSCSHTSTPTAPYGNPNSMAPLPYENANTNVVDAPDDPLPPFKASRDFKLAFTSLMMLCLAVSLDATTLSVALPIMSADLGGTALQAFWSGTGFLLASAVFQPVVISLSFTFGRCNLIYATSLLFAVGSVVAAIAKSFNVVIIGRVIQGGGGGGIIALTGILVTDLIPLSERGKYISVMAAIWAVGTVTGPLIGAGFAQDVSWRWIFWMNLPIIAVADAMVFFFLKLQRIPGGAWGKLARFDVVGGLLFVAGSTSFLFGVSSGGISYDWDSWQTLVSMIVGAGLMAACGFWEVMFAERFGVEPLIDCGIFSNWTIMSSFLQTILHGAILWTIIYILSLYYQGVKLYTPIISAVAGLPETLTVAPAAVVVGVAATWTGHYRWALWSGWAIAALGGGILYLMDRETSVPQWVFLNLPIGLGCGMVFPANGLAVQAASPPLLNGNAAAFSYFLRTFGQSIGVAVSGVLFQNSFRSSLEGVPEFAGSADRLSRDATVVVEVVQGMAAGPSRDALIDAYNDGLRVVWNMLAIFAGVAMLLSFTMWEYSLQQQHVTKQKFVQAEETKEPVDPETGSREGGGLFLPERSVTEGEVGGERHRKHLSNTSSHSLGLN